MLKEITAADLRALNVFKCVVACGGYEGAQDILNLNMSTISSQISGFEKRIGFRLCLRGRSGFKLTERGQAVLEQFQSMQTQLEQFRHNINALQDEAIGQLRLGLMDNMLTERHFSLIDVLAQFTKAAPKVELELVQDVQSSLLNQLLEDRLDVVIGAFAPRSKSIKTRKLFSEHQQLYCAQNHAFFPSADCIENEQVEKANWVYRGYILEGQYPQVLLPSSSTATAANLESVLMLLLTGHYIGYLPRHFAAKYVEDLKLRAISPAQYDCQLSIYLASRAGRHDTLPMRKFKQICLNQKQQS